MDVSITRCGAADIDAVVQFIDAHWERGHVLVTSRMLLDWQYRNPDGTYSFVLARRGGAVIGILGYISTRRYDPALAADNVVWLTTWKVREDAEVAGLGIALLQHLSAVEPHVAIGAVGLTPSTRPIYQALGYQVGEMHHYVFRKGSHRDESRPLIATPLDPAVDIPSDSVPRKTSTYFRQRYATHPVYAYRVVALRDEEKVVGLLAARIAEHDGRRAVRIVDFAGTSEVFGRAGGIVQSLIAEHDAEYADIYSAGLRTAALERAGFACVDPDGAEIVPDHFEPFELRNVRLWYSIRGAATPVVFKGDGDQDRPNQLASALR